MSDALLYDPIQGQGHGICEVPKIALFQLYLIRPPFTMAAVK